MIIINKKLLTHYCIYNGISILLFIITYLLEVFQIITVENKIINIIIYILASIFCLSYYYYIYKNHLNSFSKTDCVIISALYIVIYFTMIIISFQIQGVHFSLCSVFAVVSLVIMVKTIVFFLEESDSIRNDGEKKYTEILWKLKIWKNFVFVGMFIFGFLNIFFPMSSTFDF